jgi:hypothetical protein
VKGASHLILENTLDSDPWEWVDENGISGIDYRELSHNQLLVVAKLFSLAQLRYEAQVRFRYAAKGFRVFSKVHEDDVLFSQKTDSIRQYEERRSAHESLAGSAGLWYDPETISAIRKDLCLWFGMRVVRVDDFVISSLDPPLEISLKYILQPICDPRHGEARQFGLNEPRGSIAFVPYDQLIQHPQLRAAFESAFDCHAEQLVAFLYTVFRLIYTALRVPRMNFQSNRLVKLAWIDEPHSIREKVLHHWQELGSMGLLRSNKEDWVNELFRQSSIVNAAVNDVDALSKEQLDNLVTKFTWKSNMPTYSDRPLLFTELSTQTLVLDCFNVCDFLRHVFLAANLTSRGEQGSVRIGNVTGEWLEAQALEYFVRELGLSRENVIKGIVIQRTREIDLAFVFNRTLFVVDCKAMAKDAAFMEGQHRKIRNRHSEMKKELSEKLPQRIAMIKGACLPRIINPNSFDREFSLICTSAVEYLPLDDPIFWCNGMPLVGPPNELLHSIRRLSSEN